MTIPARNLSLLAVSVLTLCTLACGGGGGTTGASAATTAGSSGRVTGASSSAAASTSGATSVSGTSTSTTVGATGATGTTGATGSTTGATGTTSGSTSLCPTGSLCQLSDGGLSVCCNGACPDIADDPENCGGCGNACAQGTSCVGGACSVTSCAGIAPYDPGLGGGASCIPPGGSSLTGICWNGSCADDTILFGDPNNCGGPGYACPAGTSCQVVTCSLPGGDAATCAASCGAGLQCVETDLGIACLPSSCGADGSTCASASGGHGICCASQCVDPLFDSTHCNGCGFACPAGQVCELGACIPAQTACSAARVGQPCALPSGQGGSCCGTACVDVEADSQNCSACGAICPGGSSCIMGDCVEAGSLADVYCTPGQPDSGADCPPNTACTGLGADGDTLRCVTLGCSGATGAACINGACCANGCTSLYEDPQNCGQCGAQCASGICSGGVCFPGSGGAGCPQGCPSGGTCFDGVCVTGQFGGLCPLGNGPGLACDESGCVNPVSDPQNCGGCSVACPAGQTCDNGVCSGSQPPCLAGTAGEYCNLDAGLAFTCCPGIGCVNLGNDLHACGACANDCTAGLDGGLGTGAGCVSGTCWADVCPPGSTNSFYCDAGATQGVCCAGTCLANGCP